MTTLLHFKLKHHIDRDIPHPYVISKEVDLILQNGSPSLTYPKAYLPNVVEIGCVHCKPPKKLPEVKYLLVLFDFIFK